MNIYISGFLITIIVVLMVMVGFRRPSSDQDPRPSEANFRSVPYEPVGITTVSSKPLM